MKKLLVVLVVCAAFGAQARWSYDSTNKVIVDTADETVRWSIPVMVWQVNLALNGFCVVNWQTDGMQILVR